MQPPRAAWGAWAASLCASAGAFALSLSVAAQIPLPPRAAYAAAFALVAGSVLAVAMHTPRPRKQAAWLLAAGLALLLALRWLAPASALAPLLVMLALLAIGSVGGAAIGHGIEHPGHLLFVALVSSLADTWSVTQPQGPSAAIAQSEAALSVLAISWPMFGSSEVLPLLGAGDVVFAALYATAARAHGLPRPRTLAALSLGFACTMLAVLATELPIPALPFLGASMLALHRQARTPPARDLRRGLFVVSVMGLAFLALLARRWL